MNYDYNECLALSTSVSYTYSTKRELPDYVLREREYRRQEREKLQAVIATKGGTV